MLKFRKAPVEPQAFSNLLRDRQAQRDRVRPGDFILLEIEATGDLLEARIEKIVEYQDFEFTEHVYYTCAPLGLVRGDAGDFPRLADALGQTFDVKSIYALAHAKSRGQYGAQIENATRKG